jgi:hypothetical protein
MTRTFGEPTVPVLKEVLAVSKPKENTVLSYEVVEEESVDANVNACPEFEVDEMKRLKDVQLQLYMKEIARKEQLKDKKTVE